MKKIFIITLLFILLDSRAVMSNDSVSLMILYHNWAQEASMGNVNTILGLAYVYAHKDTYEDKQKALEYFNKYSTLVENVDLNVIHYFEQVQKDIEIFEKYVFSYKKE